MAIKETHQTLTANAASVESALGGGQNGYLGLVLLPGHYTRISTAAFERLPNPGRTATVPEWTTLGEENRILSKHTEARRKYNEGCAIETTLKNQIDTVFDDKYLLPLKNY